MKRIPLFLVLIPLTVVTSCSSTKYGDPEATETVNVDWGATDLQTLSAKMVASLKDSPSLAYLDRPEKGEDKRVIVYMGGIDNETSEHINTRDIGELIETDLLQTGRFRFAADKAGQDEIGEQVRFQQDSGRVDPAKAMAFGKQIGAEIIVHGSLSSIEKKKDRAIGSGGSKFEHTDYLFILKAVNVESGETIWADKGQIRKSQRTGLFGSR